VGVRVSEEKGMCEVARNYFEDLFLEKNSSHAPVVDNIEKVVSSEDNFFSNQSFSG